MSATVFVAVLMIGRMNWPPSPWSSLYAVALTILTTFRAAIVAVKTILISPDTFGNEGVCPDLTPGIIAPVTCHS